MTEFTPHGKHLIAGEWVGTDSRFASEPASGAAHSFSHGTVELVDQAAQAAEEAFWSYGYSSREARAAFLNAIADEIEARADEITQIGSQETGLPEARLQGERGRTTGQLRLFATHIQQGDYLDRRHDAALPDRAPLPRPDLRMIQRPIGPVAVFGASNFPLAFSTAGGDTASALAAGCPVVVKGHSAHPGTGEIIAEAVHAAIQKCDLHPGVFSFVQGGNRAVGQSLVQHPLIQAVGFTGSLGGGRALFDLCAQRPEPIPFFGELGSVNPMFMLPGALAENAAELGKGWSGSLTIGAGEFCTNPGIAVVRAGEDADALIASVREAFAQTEGQVMLTDGMASAYAQGAEKMGSHTNVQALLENVCRPREAKPFLFKVAARDWLENHALSEEVFGPLGLVIVADSASEFSELARSLPGQLTATLHMNENDVDIARKVIPVLERKAGRVLANGFPTGVEVCDAMVHGGPYPASTNFGATSVGTLAIRRFLRPVCYQNMPHDILPDDLKSLG